MKNINNKMCILIPGHDSYQDIVRLYISCLHKLWSDCHYQIIWSNGNARLNDIHLNVVNNGANASFCERILNAIEHVNCDYVLLTIEDFIISEDVDNKEIDETLKIMERNKYNFCKLTPGKNKRHMKPNDIYPYIYDVDNNMPYGLSINCGIFRRTYLISIIKNKKWNGWQLENYCLKLASNNHLCGCVYDSRNPLKTVHLIDKGKIIPVAKRILQNNGIDISGIAREELSTIEVLRKKIIGGIGRCTPLCLRKYLKKIINYLGVKTITKY